MATARPQVQVLPRWRAGMVEDGASCETADAKRTRTDNGPWQSLEAGLDEGLLSFSLSDLLCMYGESL